MSAPLSTEIFEIGPGRLEIDAAEITVTHGPDRGLTLPLGMHTICVGTDGDCDLVLHDRTVSSRHAEIRIGERGYVVRDLGSKNGLRIGPVAIERAPLCDGTRLHLGSTELSVRSLGTRHTIPLASPGDFGGLSAQSVSMRALVAELAQLANSDTTVLIEGETGTGKEVAAQALHDYSARARGPFVVLDCGAVPRSLLAAELFGHERGAFSGALEARKGLLEQAHGGTLFLDEVTELPLDAQPLLLRALDSKSVRRIGGGAVAYDVRVIVSTARNLSEEVRAHRFREDLYFRLAVARVRLPPLRERREDIPALAHAFARECGVALPPELLALLTSYDWPGNVRELRNAVARAAIQKDPAAMLEATSRPPMSLPAAFRGPLAELPEARREAMDSFEREYVREALARAGGSISRAAELAGVSRQMFTRLAEKHGLRLRDRLNLAASRAQ
jgi:DNA-binding NtrC family response regulator